MAKLFAALRGTIGPWTFERSDLATELAAVAARLVVDEGLDYAGAKRQAVKLLGLTGARFPLPRHGRHGRRGA